MNEFYQLVCWEIKSWKLSIYLYRHFILFNGRYLWMYSVKFVITFYYFTTYCTLSRKSPWKWLQEEFLLNSQWHLAQRKLHKIKYAYTLITVVSKSIWHPDWVLHITIKNHKMDYVLYSLIIVSRWLVTMETHSYKSMLANFLGLKIVFIVVVY